MTEIQTLSDAFCNGSVGMTFPKPLDILSENWVGPHPDFQDKKYPIRSYTSLTAYRLIQLKHEIGFAEQRVTYLREDDARLLVSRDQGEKSREQIQRVNRMIEESKIPGKEVVLSYMSGEILRNIFIPANDQTMGMLAKAFDIAALKRCHVIVNIDPQSFDATLKVSPTPSGKTTKFSL